MNRRYRLVYSRARNMLVAVEETATAAGKAGETRATGRAPLCSAIRVTLCRFLPAALLALAPMLTFAQIVSGGAHAPGVIQTPNGLDQVNINRPSGAGVSVNTYNRFDVQSKGAILNNSPTIVQTQQGGTINGNPNFAAGQSAKIIVNQINSASASQLNGFLETAGNRAEVIIANPSGISVSGGGFINTSRAILTTGTPNYAADGSVSGFNVTGGNITVSGAGLNASNVDQVDFLARAVQANAAIYAKNLNVVTGANSVDHNTLSATPIAGDGPVPGVSIDVSNLGGMYANRIVLVGTEAGVGVSLKGVVGANAGDLVLTTQGKLELASQASAPGQAMSGVSVSGLNGNASGAKSGAASVNGGANMVDPAIASATAQNVLQNLTVPQGGLFRPATTPGATYIVEGNPAFTNAKNFISSDYYLQQLGLNPQTTEKRLGDGMYEQQLVRNQVTALTGTYSDIQNQSHYDANSNGISAGVGFGGSTGKAVGPGSVSGTPSVSPMISQNESGDSSATTRSAVSAGTINVTNGAGQTQDIANLSRDTTNTNGTVGRFTERYFEGRSIGDGIGPDRQPCSQHCRGRRRRCSRWYGGFSDGIERPSV
jgi:filamentous hemagglutinin family protein